MQSKTLEDVAEPRFEHVVKKWDMLVGSIKHVSVSILEPHVQINHI
jgi:hypothetical protein